MYLPVVLSFQWASFVTLTLKVSKNVENDLNRIILSFRKLRRREVWKANKGIFNIEILKKDENDWYVHLHALVDSKWMDQKELSKAWFELTEDSSVVDIRRVQSGRKEMLREVLKYQTKIWELNESEKEFVEKTFKHRHFVNSFGIKRPEKPKFEGMNCKICGGKLELFEKGISNRRNYMEECYQYQDTS